MKKIILIISYLLMTFLTNAQYTVLHDFGKITGNQPMGSLFFDGTFLYGVTGSGGTSGAGTIFKMKPDGTENIILLNFDGTTTGSLPRGPLISDGTFLYGVTTVGGAYHYGTIFKIKPDGTGYVTLFDFNYLDSAGYSPNGSLIYDGTSLFGMTEYGGAHSKGIIYKINTDGTGYSVLLDFDGITTGSYPYTSSLISDGTFLYGMTTNGGSNNMGTIIKIKPDGTAFTKLLDLDDSITGSNPRGSLISDGTFLYGMTTGGGANDFGTIIKIKPDGTAFTKLLDFDDTVTGKNPSGSLILDGSFLYGMTNFGGAYAGGTIFKIKSNGEEYSTILDLRDTTGKNPLGSLISDGTFLYGATPQGGAANYGTVFKIQTDGTTYTKLLDFDDPVVGGQPNGSLISDGTFLYGMTETGGTNYKGIIFKIKPDGTEYTTLFNFDGVTTGGGPRGTLISDGTFLYGMTINGGENDQGTIFKIKPDGTYFTKLVDFNDTLSGSNPPGSLIFDDGFLCGMTWNGGMYDKGVIFKLLPDGTDFIKLMDFDSISGVHPYGSLISDGTFLYGMTSGDEVNALGTIFKIKPDGTSFTKLLDFDGSTNGKFPYGSFFSDSIFLYGMTYGGGLYDKGTIFKLKPDGTEFSKLFDFDNITSGSNPRGPLISDGTFLYGMAQYNEMYTGNIFKIKPDGTNYTKLHDFDGYGADPRGSLISDGSFLYGMTLGGGVRGTGVIFKMNMTLPSCIANYTEMFDSASDNYTLKVDSSTTSLASSYHWDFGDGSTSALALPTHTFTTPGSYNVCLKIYTAGGDSCSYCQMFTGDAGFTINIPDTTVIRPCIAGYTTDYDSTLNTFILNVDSATTALATSYHWDFGDGSTSTLSTPSHVYTVDSLYNVCMRIFYADGDSCTYCHTIGIDSAGNIIRDGGFSLVVHNARTGVSESTSNEIAVSIYPNPTTGIFQLAVGNGQLNSTATLCIYNVVGEKIYVKDGKQLNSSTTIDLSDQPNGIYFMQLKTAANTITKKIIINK